MRTEKEQDQVLEGRGAWGFVTSLEGFCPERDGSHRRVRAQV